MKVPKRRYDVFISFDRKDRRSRNFAYRLKEELEAAGVTVFLDDEQIRPGESIEAITKRALHTAKIFIPLVSESYATSVMTLDELQRITEIRKIYGRSVVPVELDFEEGWDFLTQWLTQWEIKMALRIEKYDFKMEKLNGWGKALTETLDLRGMKLKDKKESEFIQEIVEVVKEELKRMAAVPDSDLSGNISSEFSKRRRLQVSDMVDCS